MSYIWVNFGLGNGLLPDGTKPPYEPKLICHLWGPLALTEDIFAETTLDITH